MTTPMTFEDYFKQTFPYGVRSAHTKDAMKAIWNACEAQQAQVIAELVEALDELAEHPRWGGDDIEAYQRWINSVATKAIAKVKGK